MSNNFDDEKELNIESATEENGEVIEEVIEKNTEEGIKEVQDDTDEKVDEVDSEELKGGEWSSISEERSFLDDLKQWLKAILIAVVIAYLLNVFIFERARVDGDSMLPTLKNNESLFEYKLGYLFGQPKRGEIIIFEYDPGKYESKWMPFDNEQVNYVKRVIALPGETIDIKDGKVYINGRLLIEPYLADNTKTKKAKEASELEAEISFPYTVPDDHYFVMGDNREHSKDSRFIGAVPKARIRGKVEFVMLPVDSIRSVVHTQPYFEGEQNPNEAE